MNKSIAYRIDNAKGELKTTLNNVAMKYELPASILEGVLNSILNEVQSQSKLELLNAINEAMQNTEEVNDK